MESNVVDLIMHDHRELERIFDELRHKPDQRPTLVPVMITLLTAHSRAEESEVYPAAARAGFGEDVEHSQKEHLAADQLAARVADTDHTSPDFDDALQELIDAVLHHIEEEESSVLKDMREGLEPARLDELGEAFLRSRAEHLGDMPADITREQLRQQADNADVSGTSGQSKEELKSTLADEADL
jgi:hemerythrin superfamily protein